MQKGGKAEAKEMGDKKRETERNLKIPVNTSPKVWIVSADIC